MKRRFGRILAVCALLGICGCGTANKEARDEYTEPASGGYSNTEAAADASYEENEKGEVPSPEISEEKLVYTSELVIQTREYADTIRKIREQVKAYHGLIQYENQYETGYGRYGDDSAGVLHMNITVRIPAKDFEAFQNAMDGTGKIISRNISIDNITKQYSDISVEIAALQKQEERLLAMMDKAETIEEMIAVETRLTEVQTRLNQRLTWRASMDTDVEYSTIHINVDEVKEYTQIREDFGGRLSQGFIKGWKSFANVVMDLCVGFLYIFPYLLIVLVLVLLGKKMHIRIPLPRRKKTDDQKEA